MVSTQVVYLDADAVALRDVCDLYDAALAGPGAVVAAAPRPHQRLCYDANASRPGVFHCEKARALAALGARDPERDLEAFNAGVCVLHLGRWRRLKLAAFFETAMAAHARDGPLWRLGSNPPLILAAAGARFERIDPRWNCDGLGWKPPAGLDPACASAGAFVWHWSGPRKAWLPNGLYRHLWWPRLRDARCVAALPPPEPLTAPP